MSANILIQNELDENLTYSSRVGEFSSNSLWIKRLALISLLVLQLPQNFLILWRSELLPTTKHLSILITPLQFRLFFIDSSHGVMIARVA